MVRLLGAGLNFVVIGGVCASFYGYTANTYDLDICCEFTETNVRKIHAAVADLNPVHRITPQKLPFELTENLFLGLKNLYLGTSLGILDCLSEVAGIGAYDEVFRQSTSAALFSRQFRFLTIDALINAKRATARSNDMRTVGQLEAIREVINKKGQSEQK